MQFVLLIVFTCPNVYFFIPLFNALSFIIFFSISFFSFSFHFFLFLWQDVPLACLCSNLSGGGGVMLPRMHLWSVSQSVNWSDTSSKPLFLLVNLLLTSLACTLLPLLRLYQHVSFFSSLFHTHANFVGFRDFSIELSFFKLLCGILMTVDSF